MKRVIKQIWRGCGELPHVGEHPGNIFLVAMILAGGIAGAWAGAGIMAMFLIPLYLYGAYDRAEWSDVTVSKEEGK